jgi:hypothetical protein
MFSNASVCALTLGRQSKFHIHRKQQVYFNLVVLYFEFLVWSWEEKDSEVDGNKEPSNVITWPLQMNDIGLEIWIFGGYFK